MKKHAIALLGGIRGHTKVLKMISLNHFRGLEDFRDFHDAETQIIMVP